MGFLGSSLRQLLEEFVSLLDVMLIPELIGLSYL